MRSYLVVAHKTLLGLNVLGTVTELAQESPAHFHLVVPMDPPATHAWSEGEVRAAAGVRLEEALAAFRAAGLEVTGEVGDGHPVEAVLQVLRRGDVAVDEVILSTLPPGPSRWLRWDVPHRLVEAVAPVPVRHVTVHRTDVPRR